MTQYCRTSRNALTLVEMLVVLAILAGLAGVMVPIFTNTRSDSAERTTKASLVAIRDALTHQWVDTKYVPLDDGTGTPATAAEQTERFQIRWLFDSPVSGMSNSDFDPDTRIGWNGPYLASFTGRYSLDSASNFDATYGAANDPAILDSFTASPIVVQVVGTTSPCDVRIVAAGADGELDISPAAATADLVPEGGSEPVGDDIYVSTVLR